MHSVVSPMHLLDYILHGLTFLEKLFLYSMLGQLFRHLQNQLVALTVLFLVLNSRGNILDKQ